LYVIAVPVRNVNKSGVRTNLATGGHVTFPPYRNFKFGTDMTCTPGLTGRGNFRSKGQRSGHNKNVKSFFAHIFAKSGPIFTSNQYRNDHRPIT